MPSPPQIKLVKESYFPTQIYFVDLTGADVLNTSLLEQIRQWRRDDPKGIVRSNVERVNAWHSAVDMHRKPWSRPLAQRILGVATGIFDDLGYDPECEPAIDNMWANISPRYAFNRHHTHPGVLWSGVYYVQAPKNSGRIFFTDPRPQVHVLEARYAAGVDRKAESWAEVYYEPIEGRLILFPAWLRHEVEPNLAEGDETSSDRISVSFNVFQRKKSLNADPDASFIVARHVSGPDGA